MKAEFLLDLDLLLEIRQEEVWCLANNLSEKKNCDWIKKNANMFQTLYFQ